MTLQARTVAVATLLPAAVIGLGAAAPQEPPCWDAPVALGLDHVVVAVRGLDLAAARYRQLGFTLKQGRPHTNGIRNEHVKFPDGTEIELLTVVEARDALTAEYLAHLSEGDGPAFVAFFVPDMNRLTQQLDAAGQPYRRSGGLLSFPEGDALRYVFFGSRRRSPTDQARHFRHANGAEALVAVWIADDTLSAERRLLTSLGASIREENHHVPDGVRGTVAKLPQAEVRFLPGSRQLMLGRRIVGVTVRTADLESLRRVLAGSSLPVPPVVRTNHGSSISLSPSITHGLWLEFREDRR